MRIQAFLYVVIPCLLLAAPAMGGDCQDPAGPAIQHPGPVGGWSPYGGLLRWWPQTCGQRCGAPDDYCRKSLPRVCWPGYPCNYTWGPPEVCYPCCAHDCSACPVRNPGTGRSNNPAYDR
jgi:hypothetical protein